MASRRKSRKEFTLADLIARYQKTREAGKRAYARSDRLMNEIAKLMEPGEPVQISESGRKAVLHDKFAESGEKGVMFTPALARRWDLEVIEP